MLAILPGLWLILANSRLASNAVNRASFLFNTHVAIGCLQSSRGSDQITRQWQSGANCPFPVKQRKWMFLNVVCA